MDITLNAVAYRSGKPFQTTLDLTQRSDGTWHATNFGDVLQGTYNASKSSTLRSPSCDTCEADTAARTRLSDQEIAELARKYDLRSMTQDQYDAFLDDLAEKGALSRFDVMKLGYRGWNILDISPESFASGGIGCGSAYAVSAGDSENGPIQSLKDVDGDLICWLESMLARQNQNKEPLNVLADIVKRMRAI